MSQQVIVDRDILLRGAAAYQPNVKGPMLTELKIVDETFVNDSLGDWDEQESHGTAITHSAVDGGAMIITGSNTLANDCGELSHTAQYSPASNCGVEIKCKISQITDTCIALGFVDAKEATNDHIAGEIDSGTLRDPTVTDEAALFVFDTDTTAVWYVGAIEAGSAGTPLAAVSKITTTPAPVANTYFRVRVQTDTSGNVTFYLNGEPVGYLPDAIAAASTDLYTPYVGFITHVAGAQVCTISRITTWQDCS